MFATMQTPFGGGFGSPRGGGGAMAIQMELGQLKAAPVLNPHFGMVIKYLDCLNRLMDALIMSNGPDGVRHWLVEVQTFIRVLQKRIFQRMPLTPQERSAIISFVAYWRQMGHPPYAMGRPEAQLVLIALQEFATM
ncbi:hypothetical protein JCM24511_01720 [Saitozyma sp. JCM 24511]|nr:hypothetical protein JCM24511_01720 [Saitozyma sp. JCM 24511]